MQRDDYHMGYDTREERDMDLQPLRPVKPRGEVGMTHLRAGRDPGEFREMVRDLILSAHEVLTIGQRFELRAEPAAFDGRRWCMAWLRLPEMDGWVSGPPWDGYAIPDFPAGWSSLHREDGRRVRGGYRLVARRLAMIPGNLTVTWITA